MGSRTADNLSVETRRSADLGPRRRIRTFQARERAMAATWAKTLAVGCSASHRSTAASGAGFRSSDATFVARITINRTSEVRASPRPVRAEGLPRPRARTAPGWRRRDCPARPAPERGTSSSTVIVSFRAMPHLMRIAIRPIDGCRGRWNRDRLTIDTSARAGAASLAVGLLPW